MDSRLKQIWSLLMKANEQEKKQIIERLTDEEVEAIFRHSNPMRQPIYKSKHKTLEFSFFNMQLEYMRNLMMTSMVGFIYKMVDEYAVPEDLSAHLPSELEGDFALALNNKFRYANILKLEKHYGQITKTPQDHARWLRSKAIVAKKLEEENKIRKDKFPLPEFMQSDSNQLEVEARNYCKENGIVYESVYPTDVAVTTEELDEIKNSLKLELNVKQTRQDFDAHLKENILDFLDYYFKFDPNNHIRCNYMPNYDKILQEKIKSGKNYNTQKFPAPKIAYECGENKMLINENFEEYLIPPVDTFHAFTNYYENNYEHLRQCTDDIWGKLNMFEVAVIPREVFDDENKAVKWEKEHANELDVSVMRAQFNNWTFLDSWKENREKLVTNDEKTRLIKEILEKKKEDEQVGKQLLNKKAKK